MSFFAETDNVLQMSEKNSVSKDRGKLKFVLVEGQMFVF
jgi:hypothetical protein